MFSQRKRSASSRHRCLFQSGKIREPPKTCHGHRIDAATLVRHNQWIGNAKTRGRESRTSLDSVSAVCGLFSVECFQVARDRRGPLICTFYAMAPEPRKRWRNGAENRGWKRRRPPTAQPAEVPVGEATFLLLREISYSSNACLELCGAHVNGKSPADCSDNEFGGFGGEAMAKNRPWPQGAVQLKTAAPATPDRNCMRWPRCTCSDEHRGGSRQILFWGIPGL